MAGRGIYRASFEPPPGFGGICKRHVLGFGQLTGCAYGLVHKRRLNHHKHRWHWVKGNPVMTDHNEGEAVLRLNQQQLELVDRTVERTDCGDRASLFRKALEEFHKDHFS